MQETYSAFVKTIRYVKRITETAVDRLSVFLLSGIFVLGIAQVIWRWILNDPIVWSEELIQLIYVWICYMGWTIAERKDSHIRITSVCSALPMKAQKWLQAFNHILCIAFSVLMVVYGVRLVGAGAKRTAVSLALSYGIVYVMGPICNFIIVCYETAGLLECMVKGPRDYSDKGGNRK